MTAPTPDLAAIKARADAATEGPWAVAEAESNRLGNHRIVYRVEKDEQGTNWQVAVTYGFSNPGIADEADAEFIAHARTDVPNLLAALDAANARITELEAGR